MLMDFLSFQLFLLPNIQLQRDMQASRSFTNHGINAIRIFYDRYMKNERN